MGVKFWAKLVAFAKFLVKLAILTGWLYVVVGLASVNLWVGLPVWGLIAADFWLWLREPYCDCPWWFDWFPPGNGFYCWWMMRPRKARRK